MQNHNLCTREIKTDQRHLDQLALDCGADSDEADQRRWSVARFVSTMTVPKTVTRRQRAVHGAVLIQLRFVVVTSVKYHSGCADCCGEYSIFNSHHL